MSIWLPHSLIRMAGPTLVTALAASWRMVGPSHEPWREMREAGKPFIFLLWHETLLPLLWWHRREGIAIVVSQAREGQYLADYAEQLGYSHLYGSSTRGGAQAMLGAMRSLNRGQPVALTPDGPVGPRRIMKPGIVRLAQRTSATIVPLHATADTSWRLRSWDRFVVPRPFSKVAISCGTPFSVAPGNRGFAEGMSRCVESLRGLEQAG